MRIRFFVALLAALPVFSLPAAAPAATLVVDSNGKLTGATGVNVGGTLYDMTFVEGTCAQLFAGCDQNSDFAFITSAAAELAGQALIDQVFLNTSAGLFDSDPSLTFGCNYFTVCDAIIPYSIEATSSLVQTRWARNQMDPFFDFVWNGGDVHSTIYSSAASTNDTQVWALFQLSPVPEPSTWTMMLVGFAALGFGLRCSEFGSARSAQ